MAANKRLLLLPGDGIGPEVMHEVRRVIDWMDRRRGLRFELSEALVGGAAIDAIGTPIAPETIEAARTADAVLFGAVGGPQWDTLGFDRRPEIAILALRRELGLFANLRPAVVLDPLVDASTLKPEVVRGLDLMIVRESTGGLYFGEPRGIETLPDGSKRGVNTEVYTTLEIERVARVAFELARKRQGRLCSVEKANVMESGLLWRQTVAALGARDYADVALSHMYADNCAMQLAKNPLQFDVIVTSNMNGDIISDLAAGLVGGLGIAPSANLGDHVAIFEAVHGSAPTIAGKGLANPTALICAGIMLLRHIGAFDAAATIEQALFITLAEGENLTGDLSPRGHGVGTDKFVGQVIDNLGRTSNLPSRIYSPLTLTPWPDLTAHTEPKSRELIGVDIFIESDLSAAELGSSLTQIAEGSQLRLDSISNRGVQVWPATGGHTFLVDHFDCRFMLKAPAQGNPPQGIADLVKAIGSRHSWMHVEKLQRFDGKDAFERPQGES
jgi:3-isopropylmalate dehydrogenase